MNVMYDFPVQTLFFFLIRQADSRVHMEKCTCENNKRRLKKQNKVGLPYQILKYYYKSQFLKHWY